MSDYPCVPACLSCRRAGTCATGGPYAAKPKTQHRSQPKAYKGKTRKEWEGEKIAARKPQDIDEPKHCQLGACERRWTTLLPVNYLPKRLMDAFGPEVELVALCSKCFGKIRSKEGAIIGYRTDKDGNTKGYVKEVLF